MKNNSMEKIKGNWIAVLLSFVFLVISCQKEERERINPELDNTIPKDSPLAKLMRNVVTHDGSFDDLVDEGNCYSINLPYTIILNSTEEIVIDQIVDYNRLSQSDNIQIQFPITITRHDYVEEIIESKIDLQVLSNQCQQIDDDIECLDFVYPFVFKTFNSSTNVFDTVEVLHDAQVFGFMDNLDKNTAVALDYPIQLLLHNGELLETTHNDELQSEIESFEASCEENDS